eukprot:8600019-Pyramimonas_sp.AAC.1
MANKTPHTIPTPTGGVGEGRGCVLSDGGTRSSGSVPQGPTIRTHTHSQSSSQRPPYRRGVDLRNSK